MTRAKFLCALFFVFTNLFSAITSTASITSYHSFHPISWMHALPTGETPGWQGKSWGHFEFSQGNVWNLPIKLLNLSNNKTLEYAADMGQTSLIFEVGAALSDKWALSLEAMHASRNGGVLDHLIDEFHVVIGNDRFGRPDYPENSSQFSIKTDGTEMVDQNLQSGLSHIKLKLKYWALPWSGSKKNNCPCGLAFSTQVKFPMSNEISGLSSTEFDYSFLIHMGAPLFKASGVWLTAGITHTPENPLLEGWPRETLHQMYELSSQFSIGGNWSFIFQMRVESPMLDITQLKVQDVTTDEEISQIASSWNSLVHWRGTESIGVGYRTAKGSSFQFLLIEDWTPGSLESNNPDDSFFVNNAPDLMFMLQSHILF